MNTSAEQPPVKRARYGRVVRQHHCGRRLSARSLKGTNQMAEDGRCRTYGPPDDFKLESVTLSALDARLAEIDGRFECRVKHHFV